MDDLITFSHALADATRWRIIQLLFGEALCVCELADILDMPQSSVSSHLQVIRKANLLDSERCEKWVYYRVAEEFEPLLEDIKGHFAARSTNDATAERDAKRMKKRLAEREKSCCPAPKTLTLSSRKHETTLAKIKS